MFLFLFCSRLDLLPDGTASCEFLRRFFMFCFFPVIFIRVVCVVIDTSRFSFVDM